MVMSQFGSIVGSLTWQIHSTGNSPLQSPTAKAVPDPYPLFFNSPNVHSPDN
jgi:hypothetical protein